MNIPEHLPRYVEFLYLSGCVDGLATILSDLEIGSLTDQYRLRVKRGNEEIEPLEVARWVIKHFSEETSQAMEITVRWSRESDVARRALEVFCRLRRLTGSALDCDRACPGEDPTHPDWKDSLNELLMEIITEMQERCAVALDKIVDPLEAEFHIRNHESKDGNSQPPDLRKLLQQLQAPPRSATRTRNEARDRFIYGKMNKGDPLKTIMLAVQKRDDWEPITTEQGIFKAAERWAIVHEKPWPIH